MFTFALSSTHSFINDMAIVKHASNVDVSLSANTGSIGASDSHCPMK